MSSIAVQGSFLPEGFASSKRRRVCANGTYFSEDDCKVDDLQSVTSQEVDVTQLKFFSSVQKKVVIYDCAKLEPVICNAEAKRELMAEWSYVLMDGPGVLVLQGAFTDYKTLDATTAIFEEIVKDEQAKKAGGGGDHFAKAGANARIWNSLEKCCVRDPDNFASYWGNHWIAGVSEAWLGPMYQMSAQMNTIFPGGKAQDVHRDYHLGFQSMETVAQFPLHCQVSVSPLLTLQGALAHVDIPVEAGPTKLLPFSHQYKQGYLAWKRTDVKQFFEENFVQLPLTKGDMLFFNPALYHAGGENRTHGDTAVRRTVNLFQVSSAFGRQMETVNRVRMSNALYPALRKRRNTSGHDENSEDCAIAACAEGYQFPSNLDLDVPDGSVAPLSQAQLFKKALQENIEPEAFFELLDQQAAKKVATV